MENQKLAQRIASEIPFPVIPHLTGKQKVAVNFELRRFVRRTRYTRNRSLGSLCDCGIKGNCLCYFKIIRDEMIEMFWADENDYMHLGDWCIFTN